MTAIIESPAFQRLEAECSLQKPALKGPTRRPGRFGFRGETTLMIDRQVVLKETIAVADDGEAALSFLAGSLPSFKDLPAMIAALGPNIRAGGKYFIYVSDLDRASRYQIEFDGVSVYVLPIDDTSVYNELIDFLYLDKTKMKKMDTAEKVDTIADGALKCAQIYEVITQDEGLKRR